ncbi:MAG TPA: SWIM zinc finger family protein [Roseiflexaceae bacterium]|nr:SWIM zinc finger family protein [Roseiflexaceae bacterium]
MTSPPRLTEADVRRWAGDASVQRGRPYVPDALFNLRRTGRTLKAGCEGSAPHPYRVEATLGARGVESARCTCPVGGDGRCKHVAALLLAWIADPLSFAEVEDTTAALERRSKEELVALVRLMLARYPDLELLLELPLPVGGARPRPNDAAIRRQIEAVFRDAGDEWDAGAEVAARLTPLVQIGRDYLRDGDPVAAATLFEALARGVLERYEELHDEEGDLQEVVNECVAGLGECLHTVRDNPPRERILHALFDVHRWDVEFGGIDMGYEATDLILALATPEERRRVAGWVREALPRTEGWARETFGAFLLRLVGDALDDEAFLRLCRDTGRTEDLVARLLDRGRTEEALAAVSATTGPRLLALADLLRERGHGEQAERIVRVRAGSRPDFELLAWLKERAVERGDLAAAAGLAERLFRALPNPQTYAALRELARQAGVWERMRPPLLEQLAKEGRRSLLIDLHLADGDARAALALLPHAVGDQRIRIAQAAEQEFPREAIAIYRRAAEELIRWQGRQNYAVAAGHLARVGALYGRLGEEHTWRELASSLRREHKRLRALQEELTKAGIPD